MQSISVSELRKVVAEQKPSVALVDVREPEEYEAGHIADAENIPLGDIHRAVYDLADFDTVYVYCRSGGRSTLACRILEGSGVNAVNVDGGFIAWERG